MNIVTTPGEESRRASTPPSVIPEWFEMEVMEFIHDRVRLNYSDNTYVIDDMNSLASALIEKYKLIEFYGDKRV